MKIKDKITFFYAIEETLWNEKVEANKYFATLSILFVALVGACNSVGGALQSMLDINLSPSTFASAGVLIFVWGLNVAESIVASTTPLTALGRSMLMLVVLTLSLGAGIIAGGIVVLVVCIILFVLFCMFLIGMFAGSSSKSPGLFDSLLGRYGDGEAKDSNGHKMKGEYYMGSDGQQKFREYSSNKEYDVE